MSEDLSKLAGEAKSIHHTLKDLLKTKEPYDREVEAHRKSLRKLYLKLLLLHPYANESKDVETNLWMTTSYAFISSYKHRITNIDRAIRRAENSKQAHNPKPTNTGPVEYRKLVQRFRQFLAEEEKFWIQLVLRMHRSFDLKEADYVLAKLGLISDTTTTPGVDGAPAPNPVFPEEPPSSLAPSTATEREGRLSLMSKALICLGDLARYRELYNEAGGRPRAGQEAGAPARRGKVRRRGLPGIEAIPMSRNYEKAQLRYELARLLSPDEGNASHQLAIVASYLPDAAVSLMHYYRALCVKAPFDPALDNMAIHLTKTYQKWVQSKQERERILATAPVPVHHQVDIFKNRVVLLHAFWSLKHGERELKDQGPRVFEDFRRLVAERNLPPDTICNIVILSQGALWKHRMIRANKSSRGKNDTTRNPVEAPTALESRIFRHLLDVHTALLEVGRDELKEVPSMENTHDDLAQRITATFRRTLPALRIASKWLLANFSYVMEDPEFTGYQQVEKSKGRRVPQKLQGKISKHSSHTLRFWKQYCLFVTELAKVFPESRLTPPSEPLEEDIDMRGWLPLKKAMGEGVSIKDCRVTGAHPNEEQLMRIFDLLSDAKAIVAEEDSPLSCENGRYSLKESVLEPRGHRKENGQKAAEKPSYTPDQTILEEIRNAIPEAAPREEDAMTEGTSRTDDDIVNDAFKHVGLGAMEEDDDDEEQIVWNPKALSPTLSPLVQATSVSPAKPLGSIGSTKTHGSTSPPHASLSPTLQSLKTPIGSPRARAPTVSSLTAQDLLQNVLTVGKKPGAGLVPAPRDSPAMQPALLFGSELTHQPITHSIWAASREEQMYKLGGSPAIAQVPLAQTSPRTYPHTIQPSHDLSTHSVSGSIWSSPGMGTNGVSSFSSPGQMNIHNQNTFAAPPQQNGLGLSPNGSVQQHRRVPSSSNSMSTSGFSHLYGGGSLSLKDPAIQAASLHPGQPQYQQQQGYQHQLSTNLPNSQALLFQQLQQQHAQAPDMIADRNGLQGFYQQTMQQGGGHGRHPSLYDMRQPPLQSFGVASPLNPQTWGKIG